MDFLKEIEPYKEYEDLYLNKNCTPSYSVRLKMSKVYDDLRKDKRVQIYGTDDYEIRPIEQGCSPCIKRMMIDLRNWIKLETDLAQENLTEFKGVPQVNKKDMEVLPKDFSKESVEVIERMTEDLEFEGTLEEKTQNLNSLANQIATQMGEELNINLPIVDPTKLKWGEFKTYCKEQGLNVNKKKRVDLENELREL